MASSFDSYAICERQPPEARITTVIATSPTPSMPGIYHLRRTVESLELVRELATSPVLIVFDAPCLTSQIPLYDAYKTTVHRFCGRRPNVRLIELQKWGHLSGVMELAIEHVQTPFLFVQQHDLPCIATFALACVLQSLTHDPSVKHVRLNRRNNQPIGWDRTPLFAAYPNPHVPLTRTGCWSDQSHVTTAHYYRDVVLPRIRGRRVFMESIMNPLLTRPADGDLVAAHACFGTYIYGHVGAPPIIAHTDARNDNEGGAPC